MPPPNDDHVAVTDGAFHYVPQLVNIINTYATRQAAAESQVNAALSLDKIFVGEEGAALRQAILTGEQDVHSALRDTHDTIFDMKQLGYAADYALRDVRNTDQVVEGLFQRGQEVHGDPSKADRPLFKPGTTRDSSGQPVDPGETGPGSLQEEMEQAEAAAQAAEQARRGGGQ
ncbi:MAG TPA: hypothetical protein VMU51_36990 [Mycobacteriales bacterium]|nr:hypothetical protein [Mycobacteriales bacterium]